MALSIPVALPTLSGADSHVPEPYKNKIFHTTGTLQIDSIEDAPKAESGITASPLVAIADSVTDKHEEQVKEMRMWFDESMRAKMGLPNGYSSVAVLLIKWADELDDLKTWEEAQNLEAVFRDKFYYHTQTVELNLSTKPQHQINRHVTQFVETHDGPNNLIIVYYTGHGYFVDATKNLELRARDPRLKDTRERGLVAQCNWNKAEDILRSDDVECDVLTILDTCYASNLVKSAKEENRVVEMLSACSIDQTTAAGDNSFTRVLIDALKELLGKNDGKPISTYRLNEHILLDERRHDTPSQLWCRSQNSDRHILLTPLKSPENSQSQSPTLPQLPRSYLTLRFALRHERLNWDQIEYLTKCLAASFHKKAPVALRRVDWVNFKSASITPFQRVALATYVVKKWRNIVKKKQEERIARRRVDEVRFPPEPMVEDFPCPSPTKKRARDIFEDHLGPDRKRENVLIHQPISPPRSECSRNGGSSPGAME